MFELSVARKYLAPRWRQLSVSIISLISILVIALVVWLVVVFFSVTAGLQKSWVTKLIALTAPVRITPTEAYYKSYFYLIDSISSQSNFTLKTINEKFHADIADPYDHNLDEEVPRDWQKPDLNEKGEIKDLVKLAFAGIDTIKGVPGLSARDYEMTVGNLKLQLIRPDTQSQISQATYLGSFDPTNKSLLKTIVPLDARDLNNLLNMTNISSEHLTEDDSSKILKAERNVIADRLAHLFSILQVHRLSSGEKLWSIPASFYPHEHQFTALAIYKYDRLAGILIPPIKKNVALLKKEFSQEGMRLDEILLKFEQAKPYLITKKGKETVPKHVYIALPPGTLFEATLIPESLANIRNSRDIQFSIESRVQDMTLKGKAPLGNLSIEVAHVTKNFEETPARPPSWLYSLASAKENVLALPSDSDVGEGILLPRPFREAGVLVGDRGFLSYAAPTTSSVQEQRTPVYVAGFYDPGIIPIGGKFVLVSQEVTSLLQASQSPQESNTTNGINVRFDHLEDADKVKEALTAYFKKEGISSYWKVETYREYDFTRDLLNQLNSEKNLFSLLATIIIIVACSNIISMLIILVNDKKTEIGILRSMGATSFSIAAIFGFCGVVMGAVGSLLGILAAILTLQNLNSLVRLLSTLQGHEMFNPLFFGETLPSDLSFEALSFVVLVTSLISLLAGLIPAIKASMMRPSAILKSE